MTRIPAIQLLGACLSVIAVLTWGACKTSLAQSSSRPNVILIMTDDQGYGDLACHGNPFLKTPALDSLYAQSIRLSDFHVGTTCSPTRAALMTGLNCNRVGVWHTIAGRSQLRPEFLTMAEVFAQNGYRTGMFGKWHLGDNYPMRPQDQGFEHAFYHGAGGVGQMPDYWNNDYFDDHYMLNGEPGGYEGYCTDVWFNATLDFIEEKKNGQEPFFAYLATNAPHGPYHVDSSYIRPYLGNPDIVVPNFYGMITQLDDNMRVLMNKLEEWGISENTILIFMTDNGSSAAARLDREGYVRKGYNAGLRGMKGSQYEGGHKVPCFIRWPKQGWMGGRDIAQLTAHLDLIPTFIDALNLEIPEDYAFDGLSLLPLFEASTEPEPWDSRVIITDTQRDDFPEKWKKSATMQGAWRLINGKELYHIDKDPGQRNDVASEHPVKVAELRKAYEEWWEDLEPSFEATPRPIIGDANQPDAVLYSHDWHEVKDQEGERGRTPWNQKQVREGLATNGFWTVEIAEGAEYEVSLCRWPLESGLALQAGVEMKPAVDGGQALPEGKAFAIESAKLKIGEQSWEQEVEDGLDRASFSVKLDPGPTHIQTWFRDEEGKQWGAYYVYIKKKS